MFGILSILNNALWDYLFIFLITAGLFLGIKSNFVQLKVLGSLPQILSSARLHKCTSAGINPIKLFFASVGAMVGIGNIVAVIEAILIGGPGAVIWLMLASFCAMPLKYSEIYLGVKFRKKMPDGSYEGGCMHILQQAFNKRYISMTAAIILCIYGVDVYQFTVVTDVISDVFCINKIIVVAFLLCVIMYICIGGIKRLANFCCTVMPIFIIIYIVVGIYVIAIHYRIMGGILLMIFESAFSIKAVGGGLFGAGIWLAASQGAQTAVYSGDLCIGSDSIIQSRTSAVDPKMQARLSIMGLFCDSIICVISMMIVLIHGQWPIKQNASTAVAYALEEYVIGGELFVAALIFIAGFSTILAFFSVAIESATYISRKYGKYCIILYAILAFWCFSFNDPSDLRLIMGFSSGLLVILNLLSILKLRSHIDFSMK